jgi:hypothetical protein
MPSLRNGILLLLTVFAAAGYASGCASPRPDVLPARDPASPGVGAPGAVTASPASAASAAPPTPPGPGDWATWSHAQKLAYMKSTFIAQERDLFGSFEPSRYANLECQDCHGSGVRDGSFRMPNPELPKLAAGPDGFKDLATHEPEVLAFMQKRVVPETARLLGVPAFDFESHTGFSCFHCHLRKPSGSGK